MTASAGYAHAVGKTVRFMVDLLAGQCSGDESISQGLSAGRWVGELVAGVVRPEPAEGLGSRAGRHTMTLMGGDADIERARALVASGQPLDALALLDRCFGGPPPDPEGTIFYAVLHAEERGMVREAMALCQRAIAQAPQRADFYLAVGRIHLKAADKAAAVRAFRDGLQIDAENTELQEALAQMGLRRPPVLASLPRNHPLNKYLGILRAKLFNGAHK